MTGHRTWFVPDGFLPKDSSGDQISHETICVLNVGDVDAQVVTDFYFEHEPPMRTTFVVPAERTRHVRIDDAAQIGLTVPRGVPYAYRLTSSVAVVVQHSRLDATQPALALFTTMAFAGADRNGSLSRP